MRRRYSELESISKSYSTFAFYDRPLQFKISSWTWGEVLVERFKPELTDSLALVLIDLLNEPDSSSWKPEQFPNNYVFHDNNQVVDVESYAKNWSQFEKREQERLQQELLKWCNTNNSFRRISQIARPLMTSDGNYGLVAYSNFCGMGCGHGAIILYRFAEGRWLPISILCAWIS